MPATAESPRPARRRGAEADEPPERTGTLRMATEEPNAPPTAQQRVRELVKLARGHQRALILTHDNPDPDALASAVGLAYIIEQKAGVQARVAFGGIVGRAENRALVKVLKLPAVPASRLDFAEFDLFGLVDTQPECTNHVLVDKPPPQIVVDHHPARTDAPTVAFADVGGDFGATASIVTSYLRASGLELPRNIATALFYGIKSDTRDLGREFEPIDVENYHWLFPQVDHVALSKIEHPVLPASYFAALHRAYGRARRHGEAVVADLGKVYAPDIVAEAADRLLSLEDMRWSLALGEFEGQLFFSIRTSDRRMNAGRLVREVLDERGGSAGGHGSMAGGRIPLPEGNARHRTQFRTRIVNAFLRGFGAPLRGERIV